MAVCLLELFELQTISSFKADISTFVCFVQQPLNSLLVAVHAVQLVVAPKPTAYFRATVTVNWGALLDSLAAS